MLKILSSNKNNKLLYHGGKSRVFDFLRTLNAGAAGGSYNYNTSLCNRATFCSCVEAAQDDLPTEVVVLPLMHKPLFPGAFEFATMDSNLAAFIQDREKSSSPVIGAFLLKKYMPETNPGGYDLKGKVLYNRLHKVGTLADVIGFYDLLSLGCKAMLLEGCRRIQITEMVNEDPLTVKVSYLEDKPYDKDDDDVIETSNEIITTLREIGKRTCERIDRALIKRVSKNVDSSLADLGAAMSGTYIQREESQQVLETLHVPQRLDMALCSLKDKLLYLDLLGNHEWHKTVDKTTISEHLSVLLQERDEATNKVK